MYTVAFTDARMKVEYDESHIITAKRVHLDEDVEFIVPYDAELECKVHVIVYDGNTRSLREKSNLFIISIQYVIMLSFFLY